MNAIIVWFRQDLRVTDHPALLAAVESGRPIVPVFIWSPNEETPWQPGAASRWWLHFALGKLSQDLLHLASACEPMTPDLNQSGAKLCSPLVIVRGPNKDSLTSLSREYGADSVYMLTAITPSGVEKDQTLNQELAAEGITLKRFHGNLLLKSQQVLKGDGKSYGVFTPFYKAALKHPVPEPLSKPKELRLARKLNKKEAPDNQGFPSLSIDSLELLPKIPWDSGFAKFWGKNPCHMSTASLLSQSLGPVGPYEKQRDYPSLRGTSRLSPFLHFGQVSPRQIYHSVVNMAKSHKSPDFGASYLRQLYWREFAHDQLLAHPSMDREPLRQEFSEFPTLECSPASPGEAFLKAWQRGMTGFPIVDAAMRELWTTGFMHNRCRMIVGSFLVKDLLISWQLGAQWFWDTLVDADLANNSMGWQWIAGCGIDAAPYFRIFNPLLQSQRFDPDGVYIKTYVPELANLSGESLHAPWLATPLELAAAGVKLGTDYPLPIVDHSKAKLKAMVAYQSLKAKA